MNNPVYIYIYIYIYIYEYIYKINQSNYRPGETQMVPGIKVPRFRDNGTG